MKRSIYVAEVDAIVHFDDEVPTIVDIETAGSSSMGTWGRRGIERSIFNVVSPEVLEPLNRTVRTALKERRDGGPCLDVPRPTPWERLRREPYTGPVATSCTRSVAPFVTSRRRES